MFNIDNRIWLYDDIKKAYSVNRSYITDPEKHQKLLNDPKLHEKCIKANTLIVTSRECRHADISQFDKCKRMFSHFSLNKDGFPERVDYVNPFNYSYGLLSGYNNPNLMYLFSSLSGIENMEEENYERIKALFILLLDSNIPKEEIKDIISSYNPGFSFFALEVLDCLDFETLKEYDRHKMSTLMHEDRETYEWIQGHAKFARGNTQVLTLARRVNNTLNGKEQ